MIVHITENVSKSQMALRNTETNLVKATMTPLNIVGLSKFGFTKCIKNKFAILTKKCCVKKYKSRKNISRCLNSLPYNMLGRCKFF